MSPMRPSVSLVPTARPHGARIAVISPVPLEREGLKLVLEGAGFRITIEAPKLAAISPELDENAIPELFVIDVPAHGDIAQWRAELGAVRQRFALARIVLLSNRLTADWWLICSELDLDGYLSKGSPPKVFKHQLNLILAGERMFPFEILHETATQATSLAANHGGVVLSQIDEQILRHLLAGHSNRTIAARLRITDSTVKARMKSVFQKIRANNRTQAAIWALRHGVNPITDAV